MTSCSLTVGIILVSPVYNQAARRNG